jgi:hypothetical protein
MIDFDKDGYLLGAPFHDSLFISLSIRRESIDILLGNNERKFSLHFEDVVRFGLSPYTDGAILSAIRVIEYNELLRTIHRESGTIGVLMGGKSDEIWRSETLEHIRRNFGNYKVYDLELSVGGAMAIVAGNCELRNFD